MSHTIELTKVARKYLEQLRGFVSMAQDIDAFSKFDAQTQDMVLTQANHYYSLLAGVSQGTIEITE